MFQGLWSDEVECTPSTSNPGHYLLLEAGLTEGLSESSKDVSVISGSKQKRGLLEPES